MSHLITISDGEFAGWQTWPGDHWEDRNGPFYTRKENDSQVVCAFRAEDRHLNGAGALHGGCLMTFADACAFYIAHDLLIGDRAVTANMNSDFIGPAFTGEIIKGTGEVTRAGGRTLFVRGLITADDRPCLSWSAILMKVGKRKT